MKAVTTRNKYGVRIDDAGKLARTYNGRLYASKMEARYAARLDLAKKIASKRDRVVDWKPQVAVPLEVNDVWITTYTLDFVVTYADGHVEWVDVKGHETRDWRLRAKLFKALFPDRNLVIVKNSR